MAGSYSLSVPITASTLTTSIGGTPSATSFFPLCEIIGTALCRPKLIEVTFTELVTNNGLNIGVPSLPGSGYLTTFNPIAEDGGPSSNIMIVTNWQNPPQGPTFYLRKVNQNVSNGNRIPKLLTNLVVPTNASLVIGILLVSPFAYTGGILDLVFDS